MSTLRNTGTRGFQRHSCNFYDVELVCKFFLQHSKRRKITPHLFRSNCGSFYDGIAKPLPSTTPPDHLPSFLSHSTVPKLVVRNTFALKTDSLLHLLNNASISSEVGKVFAKASERGVWTCSTVNVYCHIIFSLTIMWCLVLKGEFTKG